MSAKSDAEMLDKMLEMYESSRPHCVFMKESDMVKLGLDVEDLIERGYAVRVSLADD